MKLVRTRRRLTAMVIMMAALALVASACGGSSADPVALAAAEANTRLLTLSSDISATQLLDAHTGEITSLDQVVTGDRAVLTWYWAPH